MAIKQAKVFTISSVKGGVGKTITTINLAGIFERESKKVLIMDLDMYAGAVSLYLNMENNTDIFKLVDDLRGNRFTKIEDYVEKYDEYIDVLPSPRDPRLANKIGIKYLNIVIAKLKSRYDVILIDTNHTLDEINLTALDQSDKALYIINNDLADTKNMRSLMNIYYNMDMKNYVVVLNYSNRQNKKYFTEYDLKHMINNSIDYIIPESMYVKKIEKYLLDGNILTLDKRFVKKNKKGVQVLEKIANNLVREDK